jgi:hypothetical protein
LESNSFGILAEGVLVLTNGEWFVVPEGGERIPVNAMMQKWADKRVRIVVANLEALAGIVPGKEMAFANEMTNADIAAKLKRR